MAGRSIVPQTHLVKSPFELPEPEWTPDRESPVCMECQDDFSFFKRRHHCRRCGRLCCSDCTEKKLAIPRMCFLDPVRHCDACAKVTSKENYFYNKDLKTLIQGASLCWEAGCDEDQVLHQCRLSMDHQNLFVDRCGSGALLIPMHQIITTMITSTYNNCHTFQVQYVSVEGGEEKSLRVPMTNNAPVSTINFVSALQRAVTMMQEARADIDAKEF